MLQFNFPGNKKSEILTLGAESAGNFSVFKKGKIFFSNDFGDLLNEENWKKYQKNVLAFIKKNKIRPNAILSDLHPDFKTTLWSQELAKKFKVQHVKVQHHEAHTFSAIGERMLGDKNYKLKPKIYSVVMDGTGLGSDGKIWGGEIFEVKSQESRVESIKRIGHLENQLMLGGELAIQEPARMLIGILARFSNKKDVYKLVKKYYSLNEFELFWNQFKQNFNCPETSSVGRILDAVSVLLQFSKNERGHKHKPAFLLEENSGLPYKNLKSRVVRTKIVDTTYLFKYLFKYLFSRDKKRLAATAQIYVAQGLYEIIKLQTKGRSPRNNLFISGGLSQNKIINSFLISKGAWQNKKIPAGDAGISFGQIIYYLLTNPRD